MAETPPVDKEWLRQHYARLGLHPSEAELEALSPQVQALYDAGRQVAELLMLEQEPGTVFRAPFPGGHG